MATRAPASSRSWIDVLARAYWLAVAVLACLLMTLIVTVMGVQVFFRYVLNDSLIWAEELCRYGLILLTFLLVGAAFERGEMVSLQFLMRALPAKLRLAVTIPLYLAMVAFLAVLAYYGHQFALLNGRAAMPAVDFIASSLLGRRVAVVLPMYWLYMAVPVGCVILSGHFVLALLRMLRALRGGLDPEDALPKPVDLPTREGV